MSIHTAILLPVGKPVAVGIFRRVRGIRGIQSDGKRLEKVFPFPIIIHVVTVGVPVGRTDHVHAESRDGDAILIEIGEAILVRIIGIRPSQWVLRALEPERFPPVGKIVAIRRIQHRQRHADDRHKPAGPHRHGKRVRHASGFSDLVGTAAVRIHPGHRLEIPVRRQSDRKWIRCAQGKRHRAGSNHLEAQRRTQDLRSACPNTHRDVARSVAVTRRIHGGIGIRPSRLVDRKSGNGETGRLRRIFDHQVHPLDRQGSVRRRNRKEGGCASGLSIIVRAIRIAVHPGYHLVTSVPRNRVGIGIGRVICKRQCARSHDESRQGRPADRRCAGPYADHQVAKPIPISRRRRTVIPRGPVDRKTGNTLPVRGRTKHDPCGDQQAAEHRAAPVMISLHGVTPADQGCMIRTLTVFPALSAQRTVLSPDPTVLAL